MPKWGEFSRITEIAITELDRLLEKAAVLARPSRRRTGNGKRNLASRNGELFSAILAGW
jgi:hypothetical protein